MDSVSKRLWQWRKRSELSLRDVRLAVNEHLEPKDQLSSRSTINNYEHRNQPPLRFLIALKRAYPADVDLNWLLFGEDRPWEREDVEDAATSAWATRGHEATGRWVDSLLAGLSRYQFYRDEKQDRLVELDAWFQEWAEAPFLMSKHFVPMKELTSADEVTYRHTLLAAIRPLLRVVRGDKSRRLSARGVTLVPISIIDMGQE